LKTVADQVAKSVQGRLDNGQPVLWLLSGGSSLELAVEARRAVNILAEGLLHVGLVDERYGQPGHANSNWLQLQNSGFDFTNIVPHPMLSGRDLNNTVAVYNSGMSHMIEDGYYTVAILGIGADGHIAGMLPQEPKQFAKFESREPYVSYSGPDYVRVTAGAETLRLMDRSFVYAEGKEKLKQLEKLEQTVPVYQQPAQLLKQMSDVTIYFKK